MTNEEESKSIYVIDFFKDILHQVHLSARKKLILALV